MTYMNCAGTAAKLRFLQRRWPRFYVLHAAFTGGIQALFWEVKEIGKIKSKMSRQRLSFHQLPYREMERLRQFRRDLIKAIPIGIIAIPPFANFLVIFLIAAGPSSLPPAPQRALSRVLFLTPRLPAPLLRRRLRSHVLEIRQLDRALARLGTRELSEEELRAACYLRGLDSTHLSAGECRVWLEQWLGLSCRLEASEISLLANSLVLLSLNYPRARP
ncbi:PREDICTED: LETM1 domain-containing protein 1 [Tinamus guttatus]|uniref:LETM1 domain-containing protein 1 n=1 Tax=Tinamus guttatus TaxID=94827 RepID=UPI00052F3629|nr:PREDICTED: LETM1 domain-containing protein 1 [Tinamus guttatus]